MLARTTLASALLLAALVPTTAFPASFDCNKASTMVEREICSDFALSAFDDALAYNYEQMQVKNLGEGALKDLRETQRAWLRLRNNCMDSTCLMRAYAWRVDAICDYPVLYGVHPVCTTTEEVLEEVRNPDAYEGQPGFRF